MPGIEEREESIRQFVRNNPGESERAVIRHLVESEICSKDPARDCIKRLIEKGDIILKADKRKNNKTHHLFINDQSDFNKINNRISDIEKEIITLKVPVVEEYNPNADIYPEIEKEDWKLKMALYDSYVTVRDELNYNYLTRRITRAMLTLTGIVLKLREVEIKAPI